jgi:hypothetical protein
MQLISHARTFRDGSRQMESKHSLRAFCSLLTWHKSPWSTGKPPLFDHFLSFDFDNLGINKDLLRSLYTQRYERVRPLFREFPRIFLTL